MDIRFLLRAERMLAGSRPVAPDFALLAATLRATGRPERGLAREAPCPPLAEILSGGPGWREAVAAQRGCFAPDVAERAESGA